MPRDMANKQRLDEAWKKDNTTMIGVRIQNATGIPAAMEKAMADSGLTKNAYAVEALREKLIRDGYDPEKYKPQKSE